MSEYTYSMERALDEWKNAARSQGEKIIILTVENQQLRDENKRLRGTLESLARHSVIAGSRGEYRQGQLDVLESVHRIAKAALTPQGGKGGGE